MRPYSSLTRAVFRTLLAERPFLFRECPRLSSQVPTWRRDRPQLPQTQRRTFFAFAQPVKLAVAKVTPVNIELAWGHLVDLVRALRTESRTPAQEQVVDALRFLIRSHLESSRNFTRNEIFLMTEGFNYIQELSSNQGEDSSPLLNRDDLTSALRALARDDGKERFRSDIGALAYGIFEQLQTLNQRHAEILAVDGVAPEAITAGMYAEVLSSTGRARDARDLLWNSPNIHQREYMPVWIAVTKGLFSEGLEKEAWQSLEQMQDYIGPLGSADQQDLITFLSDRGNFPAARKVYEMDLEEGATMTTASAVTLVRLCIRKEDFSFSEPIVKSLVQSKEDPKVVNTILLWHFAKEISLNDATRGVKAGLNALDIPETELTLSNINCLLEYAYTVRLPEAGKALKKLTKQIGLEMDTNSYLLELSYQLEIGDISAAKSTYDILLSADRSVDGSDIPVLNRFLAALCFSESPETERITRVVNRLLDSGADLDAEAVAGLCHGFLQRDELEEAYGLLRHRIDFYPASDRARISAIFQEFILDLKIEDQRAYNAYDIFRYAFSDTPVEQRLLLMWSFFNRNRSDLACLVFGHMRQREDPGARPTAEAYAQCFEGIGKSRDVDGLQMVYNMLKLDREVEPTTRIRNSLMVAYTACQMPFKAIIDHFWKILDSREGPTLSSFALALRACETWIPQGSQESRRIIAMMQSWGIEINREIYHCYIGALAGQSEFENTIELIEEMERDLGEKPDAVTIGTFYNAIPWQFRKDEVETWAKQAFPELWEDLVSFGDEIDEEWEVRYFKIDRTIEINDELLFGEGEYDARLARPTQIALEAPLQ